MLTSNDIIQLNINGSFSGNGTKKEIKFLWKHTRTLFTIKSIKNYLP